MGLKGVTSTKKSKFSSSPFWSVLLVGGHIDNLVGDVEGLLVHRPVGRLNKAVLIDPGIGGEIRDQADVGTFRGLDGAHAAVVGVVYVTHLESGTVTGKTTRS